MKQKLFLLLALFSISVGMKANSEMYITKNVNYAEAAEAEIVSINSADYTVAGTYTLTTEQEPNINYDYTIFSVPYSQLATALGTDVSSSNARAMFCYPKSDGTYQFNQTNNWYNAAGYYTAWASADARFYIEDNHTTAVADNFSFYVGQHSVSGKTSSVDDTYTTTFYCVANGRAVRFNLTLNVTKKTYPQNNVAYDISQIEASYTASWNYLYAIYDGTTGFGELANAKTWGSWSENRQSEQWLRYGWNNDVTVHQVNIYFWTDNSSASGAGSGVAVPASWKIQYYDEDASTWNDVTLESGESYTCNRLAVNTVEFEPVTTRQLRLVMQAQSNGSTYAALGVTEWEVLGEMEEQEVVYGDYPITNVDFSKVHLTDSFWKARMQQNQTVTIPIALEQCEKTNRMLNFEKAAAILRGENIGYFDTENTFDDTDIYKILEGMAYSIQTNYSAEMDAKMDELIALVGSAQEPDGYLYTPRTAGEPGHYHSWVGTNRWEKDPDLSHELYNCGHLYEAAYAHYISTGKRTLLDIAIKNADLLVKDFLVGGLTYEPGHQIVEMGLVKMYRATGKSDYLKLAKYFLDLRGLKGVMRKEYSQTTKPVIMQDEAVGHAVRAAYMYSGMADVAAIMGDEAYLNAIDKIWSNVVEKKYYITGGIGGKINGEAFDANYVLPNREAYCETCAAIGNVYWNWRMFLLHGDAKYYDVIERTLYNGLISGISLTGDHFFYPNPLASNGTSAVPGRDVVRSEWFGCACCPSNLCRFTASVPGYIYAHRDNDLYVNLYIQGTGEIDMPDGTVKLTQTTEMPWQGAVSIKVDETTSSSFAMRLRLPGWANGQPVPSDLYTYVNAQQANIEVKVNGQAVTYEMKDGYMTIERDWAAGDEVSFELPMNVHKTKAHENVEADRGRLSIERGPVVYCLEHPDNANQDWYLTETAQAEPVWTDDLNGLMKLTITEEGTSAATHLLTAIPYYAWANRGKGNMEVWISTTKAEYPTNINLSDIDVVGEKELTIDYYPVNDGWATHTQSDMPVDNVPAVLGLPISNFKLDMMYVKSDASILSRTKSASGGNGFWLIKDGMEAGELFCTADDFDANRRIFLNVDGFYQTDQTVKIGYGQRPNSCQSGVYETGVYMLAPRDENDRWKAYHVILKFNLQGSLIDEDANYDAPEANGITAITLRRTIGADKWSTLVLPVDLNEAQLKGTFGDNVRIAALSSATAEELQFTSVTSTKANQPYMIYLDEPFTGATIDGVSINVQTPQQEVSGASFIGSYAALTDIPTDAYFVKDNYLLQAGTGCTMKGTHAYFTVPEAVSVSARSLNINLDGTNATGIMNLENSEPTDGYWYNLQGQRVNVPSKGVFIKNGKKVLVR